MIMVEQEKYKEMLKRMIDQTKSNEIQTTDELIQALIGELKHMSNKQKKDMGMETL